MKACDESGYSLLELMIALVLVVLLCVFAAQVFHLGGDAEAVINEAARRVWQRRAEAIRLGASVGASAADRSIFQPPVEIDFGDPARTGSLITGRCDDPAATHVVCPGGYELSPSCFCAQPGRPDRTAPAVGWDYKYASDPIRFPRSWHVMSEAPPGDAALPNSRVTTKILFDVTGLVAPADENVIPPRGAEIKARVWAIYFTDGQSLRALTVNETGLVEVWRRQTDDEGNAIWQGYENRSSDTLR